ncbi:DUF4150 domain-containing protein, partial [Citrobacter sp. S2-9]
MADNVAARKNSDWIVVFTTPDVCKTPKGSSTPPIPYRVTAKLADAAQEVPTVNANSCPLVVLTQSYIPKTLGDEPGSAKGVKSGTVADICEPLEHSSSVRAAGFYVLRHDDQFYMNCKNTTGKIVGQSPSTNKSSAESNPNIVPETPKEKSGWELLAESYRLQTEDRRKLLDDISAFFARSRAWGQTPEGIGTMAAHSANFESREQAANLRWYAGENGGAEGLAAFDRTYVKGYSVLSEVGPMYLGVDSVVRTGGKIGATSDEILLPSKVPSVTAAGTDDVVLASGVRLSRTPVEPASVDLNPETVPGAAEGVAAELEGASETGKDGFSVKEPPPPEQDTENLKQPNQNKTTAGEPVDMVTGDFLQHLSVLTVPGTLPLTLTRLYRSRTEDGGLFGPKWTDEWSRFLELDDREIHFTDHEGVTLTYPLPDNGLLEDSVNSRVSGYVLSGDVNGELQVFDRRSQQHLIFGEIQGPLRRLSAIHDGYGNTATFIYRDERLVQVRHSDGHLLDLAWLDGQLATITLTAQGKTQRLVTCRHDERGMLAECDSFQFSHRWHRYSPEGFMVFWQDADGTQVDLAYDAQGRVTQTKTPEGYYNDRFIYNDAERQNTYLDAEGGQTRVWYNEDGLTVREADPLGREVLTEWENNRRKSVTDALGRVTAWHYNRYGDITRLSLPGGITLHYRYDENGNLTRFQGPGNKIWLFGYDEHGGL